MAPRSFTANVAQIYSSSQCVLSFLGSLGVILIFAGVPQLLYASSFHILNALTFVFGVVLVSVMIVGNAVLNFKYKKHVQRMENDMHEQASANLPSRSTPIFEDVPPNYEDIYKYPPDYVTVDVEKLPKYEDILPVPKVYTIFTSDREEGPVGIHLPS